MKKILIAGAFAVSLLTGVEAAPTDTVTQADLKALIERITKLEAQNQAQAKRIAELEAGAKATDKKIQQTEVKVAAVAQAPKATVAMDDGTTTNETGRIYTTTNGKKYYLADASAKIFEPLSESGLQITPYGYLVLEGVYSDRALDGDYTTDFVVGPTGARHSKRNHTTLSVQDSIFGVQFMTPEAFNGWTFSGKAEFDLVDTGSVNQNAYGFHWRHLYVNAEHAASGWSLLFGQTWHLWKMVTPSEIDGAWMENAGHPYRRSPQIRVTKKWAWEDSSFEARFGIVKGGPGMGEDRDSDGIQDNTASPWPLFEAAFVYDHAAAWQEDGRRWLVGLGGMYGQNRSHNINLSREDDYESREDDYESMMAMFAASVPFGDFTLTGQIYGGQNLGGVQAGCGQTVYFRNNWDRGDEVRAVGGFVDLSYQINETWSVAGGYGFDNPIDDDVRGGYNANGWPFPGVMWNDRAYVAAFYQLTSNCKFGLEYARLMTKYDEGDREGDYGANRLQFTAFYDF